MENTIKLSDQDIQALKDLREIRDGYINAEKEQKEQIKKLAKEGRFLVSGDLSRWSRAEVELRVFYAKDNTPDELDGDNVLDFLDQGYIEFWDGSYDITTNWVDLSDHEGDDNSLFLKAVADLIEERELEIKFL